MSECQYGCSRDYIIRDLVTFSLALDDGAKELLRCIRVMRHAGAEQSTLDMLLSCHEDMCRPVADDAHKLFGHLGPLDFTHRAVPDAVAWLAAQNR